MFFHTNTVSHPPHFHALFPFSAFMTIGDRARQSQEPPINAGNTEFFRDILIHSTKLRLAGGEENASAAAAVEGAEAKKTATEAAAAQSAANHPLAASQFTLPPKPAFAGPEDAAYSSSSLSSSSSKHPQHLSLSMMASPAPSSSNGGTPAHKTQTQTQARSRGRITVE